MIPFHITMGDNNDHPNPIISIALIILTFLFHGIAELTPEAIGHGLFVFLSYAAPSLVIIIHIKPAYKQMREWYLFIQDIFNTKPKSKKTKK